jgi:hypothetical protein
MQQLMETVISVHCCSTGAQPCPGTKDGSCTSCQPCPVGSYQPDYAEVGCKLCPVGYTTSVIGATKADFCFCKPG